MTDTAALHVGGVAGADVESLGTLARACGGAAGELAGRRRAIGSAMGEVGEDATVATELRLIEEWLAAQAADLRRRARELAEADRPPPPAAAFRRGMGAGVDGVVGGLKGLWQLGPVRQLRAARTLWAVLAGDRPTMSRNAAQEREVWRGLLAGVPAALAEDARLITRFNTFTGPPLFLYRARRDGLAETSSAYAYDLGELLPDLAFTLLTLSAGKALRAGRLTLVSDEAGSVRMPGFGADERAEGRRASEPDDTSRGAAVPLSDEDVVRQAGRLDLAEDPSHGGKMTRTSWREARIAIELERSGRLPGPVRRDHTGAGEFVDASGRTWDVKSPQDIHAQGGFDLKETLSKLATEFGAGEGVIIDTSRLAASNVALLRQALVDRGWSDAVLWYP